jgi:amino acid transporter
LDALTVLKALPLIAMAVAGLAAVGSAIEIPAALPPLDEVEAAALLVLYAFVGFENSTVPAGETVDPQRTIPRAMIMTLLGTTVLYFLVQISYVAVMEPGEGGDAPLMEFGRKVAGPAGAMLLTATALFSIGGNLSSSLTSTPRVTFALGRDGLLPRWFGVVSERYHTPANSILFMGVLTTLLALSSSFVWLAVVSTLARLFVYSASVAALPAARRIAGQSVTSAIYVLMAGAFAVCLWAALQSEWPAWRMLLALLVVGTLLYTAARRTR